MLGGVSALDDAEMAARFGLVSAPSERVEGYVERQGWARLQEDFGLQTDGEGRVLIHLTDVAPVAGEITTALDLVERGSTREKSAAERILREALMA